MTFFQAQSTCAAAGATLIMPKTTDDHVLANMFRCNDPLSTFLLFYEVLYPSFLQQCSIQLIFPFICTLDYESKMDPSLVPMLPVAVSLNGKMVLTSILLKHLLAYQLFQLQLEKNASDSLLTQLLTKDNLLFRQIALKTIHLFVNSIVHWFQVRYQKIYPITRDHVCRSCQYFLTVNGGWTAWSPWIPSSGNDCTRTRACTNPAPNVLGANCTGPDTETQACAPSWTSWGPWTACSRSCGYGYERRDRECIGGTCPGSAKELQYCNITTCSSNTQSKSHFTITLHHQVYFPLSLSLQILFSKFIKWILL